MVFSTICFDDLRIFNSGYLKEMYYLSVYAIFKNEAEIFKEWVEHYLSQGVDHFYLIDNGSTDNYKEVLEPFMDHITLIHDDEKGGQLNIYNRHILPKLEETEWVIGIDLDEFVYTKDGTIASTLRNLKDPSIGQIMIPWKQFGSSGYIMQPSSVVESFLYRIKLPWTAPFKMICRSRALKQIGVHSSYIKDEFITVGPFLNRIEGNPGDMELTEELLEKSLFRLNHYAIQSLDWFRRVKMTRGDVANNVSNVKNEETFKLADYKDVFDDDLAVRQKNRDHSMVLSVLVILLLLILI